MSENRQKYHFLKLLEQIQKDVPFVVHYSMRCEGFNKLVFFHLHIYLNFNSGKVLRQMHLGPTIYMLKTSDMKTLPDGEWDYESIVKEEVMNFSGKSIEAKIEELQKEVDEHEEIGPTKM